MKINNSASYLLANARIPAGNGTGRVDRPSSFAATMSEKSAAATKIDSVRADASAQNLDFTNMTPQQLLGAMNGLIKSGQMTLDESSGLLGLIPTALSKVNYDGKVPDAFYQPTNFFTMIQAGIDGALSRNEHASAASSQRAADALTRFQGQAASIAIRA